MGSQILPCRSSNSWDQNDETSLLTTWVEELLQTARQDDKELERILSSSPVRQREITLFDPSITATFKAQCEQNDNCRLAVAVYLYGEPTDETCAGLASRMFRNCIKWRKHKIDGCANCIWNNEGWCRASCMDTTVVVKKSKKSKLQKRKKTPKKLRKTAASRNGPIASTRRLESLKNRWLRSSDEPEDRYPSYTQAPPAPTAGPAFTNHNPDRQMRFDMVNGSFQNAMNSSDDIQRHFNSLNPANNPCVHLNSFQNGVVYITKQARNIQSLLASGMRDGGNHLVLSQVLGYTKQFSRHAEDMRTAACNLAFSVHLKAAVEMMDDSWRLCLTYLEYLVEDITRSFSIKTATKVKEEGELMDGSSG